jgi:hypothetical protein
LELFGKKWNYLELYGIICELIGTTFGIIGIIWNYFWNYWNYLELVGITFGITFGITVPFWDFFAGLIFDIIITSLFNSLFQRIKNTKRKLKN